jgi:hypothetical protein
MNCEILKKETCNTTKTIPPDTSDRKGEWFRLYGQDGQEDQDGQNDKSDVCLIN